MRDQGKSIEKRRLRRNRPIVILLRLHITIITTGETEGCNLLVPLPACYGPFQLPALRPGTEGEGGPLRERGLPHSLIAMATGPLRTAVAAAAAAAANVGLMPFSALATDTKLLWGSHALLQALRDH